MSPMDAVSTSRIWFAAYIACLLDPGWPIPGFSPEISAEIKQFLRSIEQDHFWTRHIFVPASAKSGGRVEVAAEFIERTVYESKTLLYTVQCMDYWMRVSDDDATHAFYWPCLLLLFIIGPHLCKGSGHALMCSTACIVSPFFL